jgi:hypothetical protein
MARRIHVAGAVLLMVGGLAWLAGCSSVGSYGEPITSAKETPISNVLDDPAAFAGKDLILTGQIATIDPDGKGFNLDNGRSSLLYCKIGGDYKIPAASRYHLATVEGKFKVDKDGKALFEVKGLRVK